MGGARAQESPFIVALQPRWARGQTALRFAQLAPHLPVDFTGASYQRGNEGKAPYDHILHNIPIGHVDYTGTSNQLSGLSKCC